VTPFLVAEPIRVTLLVLFPAVTLFLPHLLRG
jgi:hypothetical protein